MSNTKSLLADFLYAVLAGMAIALGGASFWLWITKSWGHCSSPWACSPFA